MPLKVGRMLGTGYHCEFYWKTRQLADLSACYMVAVTLVMLCISFKRRYRDRKSQRSFRDSAGTLIKTSTFTMSYSKDIVKPYKASLKTEPRHLVLCCSWMIHMISLVRIQLIILLIVAITIKIDKCKSKGYIVYWE